MGLRARAPAPRDAYTGTMKMLLALALSLTAAVPAAAFDDLFGLEPGYAQAQEAMRQYRLEQARQRRAQGPRTKPIGDLLRPSRVPKQDAACVFAAVGRRAGVAAEAGVKAPEVFYASVTLLADFYSWYYSEFGPTAAAPRTITTVYLPRNHAVFMDDEGVSYSSARTIDDALAGQFALYFKGRGAAIDAAETERWFNAEFTAKGRSSCP